MSGAFEEQFATAETASPLHNIEAEIGFLGDLLANNRLIDEVADRCRPADFSVPLYGRIYGKMIEQSASGAVDVVTLAPHFAEDGEWPRAYSVLAAANLNAGPKARTKAYFDQITMLSSRRRMVAGLKDVVASARNLSVTREELVADADEAVAELAEQVVTAQASVGDYAQAVIDSFGKPIIGVRCGTINSLDGAIGVLRPSNLVVVGGRPGMGKTSLVTSYSIGAAGMGHGVLIFSLEMSADELTRRMLADMTFSTRGGVPYEHVRDGTVRPHEMDAVLSAKTRFDEPPKGQGEGQKKDSVTVVTGAVAPIDPKKALFDAGVVLLGAGGLAAKSARALIAKWYHAHGEQATNAALLSAAGRAEPVSWIEARLRTTVAAQDEAREASRSTAERYRRMAIPGPPAEQRKLEEHA